MTEKTAHTPGRIEVREIDVKNGRAWLYAQTQYPITGETDRTFCIAEVRSETVLPSEIKANASRLASCWNACEGIENPEAVQEAIRTAIKHLSNIDVAALGNLDRGRVLASISALALLGVK